jgi:hypothetical protein
MFLQILGFFHILGLLDIREVLEFLGFPEFLEILWFLEVLEVLGFLGLSEFLEILGFLDFFEFLGILEMLRWFSSLFFSSQFLKISKFTEFGHFRKTIPIQHPHPHTLVISILNLRALKFSSSYTFKNSSNCSNERKKPPKLAVRFFL